MLRSLRPYMFRAWYDWILDNQMTPYIIVDTTYKNVMVPESYIKDGKIVLNITPGIVEKMEMTKSHLHFHARFGGHKHHIFVPLRAIESIFAKENQMGTTFDKSIDLGDEREDDDGGSDHTPSPTPPKPTGSGAQKKSRKSHLKIVK